MSTEPDLPIVSIAIPMLNEARYIVACLDSFAGQDYPKDRLDVMVIDGGSDDGSPLVVEAYARDNPWVRLVPNPTGTASAAFNIGIEQARGSMVGLFSSHGVADPSYISASVAALGEAGVAGVGGRYRHEGTTPKSTAIGLAMVNKVGMASPHRFATEARDVDTISHPIYWRQAMIDVGGFDEALMRNSDYEFNIRMRKAGHRLRFEPLVGSVYRPRRNLNALFRQFWFYGKWKARVVQQHPEHARLRHFVAPITAAGFALSPVAWRWRRLRPLLIAAGVAYGGVVAYGVTSADTDGKDVSLPTLAAAYPTMHLAWGAGFIRTVIARLFGETEQ